MFRSENADEAEKPRLLYIDRTFDQYVLCVQYWSTAALLRPPFLTTDPRTSSSFARSQLWLTEKVDVYSLGIAFWELTVPEGERGGWRNALVIGGGKKSR